MSVITRSRTAAYEQAYTRADHNNETVIIFVRMVVGDEADEVVQEFIVTGADSDAPPGASIETIIDPNRTPLYDMGYPQGRCC